MIDAILSLPAIIKLTAVLTVAVVLMRTRLPLATGLFVAAGLLALLFPMNPSAFLVAVRDGVLDDKTAFLVIIVVVILLFSGALNETGQIQRIVESFRRLVGRSRLTLVTYPSLIGLLPMPGGAVFSAPMVRAAVDDPDVTAERLTAANYWFRHIWEYWFPLYPGVILALTLTKAVAWKYMLLQFPMTIWALVSGYFVILHGLRLGGTEHARSFSRHNVLNFARELTPILLVVTMVLGLTPLSEAVAARWAPENLAVKQSALLVALLGGLIWLFAYRSLTMAQVNKTLFSAQIVKMVLLMVSIMVFRSVLGSCGAVETLNEELRKAGIPLFVLVSLLPFVAGMLVGIAFGFVGTSFPIVLILLEAVPAGERLPYYMLAYSMGYAGMMLSPVHLCLLLTNEYFESHLGKVYRYLLPLGLGTMAAAAGCFFLYSRFL